MRLTIVLCLMAAPVMAQGASMCADRARLLDKLAHDYGEAPVFQGLTGSGDGVFEVTASPDGSWTAIVTTPDGTACFLGAGDMGGAAPVRAAGEPT